MRRAPALLVLVAALAGCGAEEPGQAPPPPSASAHVALLAAPRRAGEILVRGDVSPATKGPFAFHGRYVVRFEQYAPEAPRTDFASQTAFVAALDHGDAAADRASIHLFRAAARAGRRTVRLDGRYFVDVSFGDFPFVVRFTPAP